VPGYRAGQPGKPPTSPNPPTPDPDLELAVAPQGTNQIRVSVFFRHPGETTCDGGVHQRNIDFSQFPFFSQGIKIAVGPFNEDGIADIAFGANHLPGAGPVSDWVKVYDGRVLDAVGDITDQCAANINYSDFERVHPEGVLLNQSAFGGAVTGVNLAFVHLDPDPTVRGKSLVVAPGVESGAATVNVFQYGIGELPRAEFTPIGVPGQNGVSVTGLHDTDLRNPWQEDIVVATEYYSDIVELYTYDNNSQSFLTRFQPYANTPSVGVRLAAARIDSNQPVNILTAPTRYSANVKAFHYDQGSGTVDQNSPDDSFLAYGFDGDPGPCADGSGGATISFYKDSGQYITGSGPGCPATVRYFLPHYPIPTYNMGVPFGGGGIFVAGDERQDPNFP
jgi:hypothetical protein